MKTDDVKPAIHPYRRKAEVVDEAVRFTPTRPGHDAEALKAWGCLIYRGVSAWIWVEKSKAWCWFDTGDYIVREPDGDGWYPCTDSAFWRGHVSDEEEGT